MSAARYLGVLLLLSCSNTTPTSPPQVDPHCNPITTCGQCSDDARCVWCRTSNRCISFNDTACKNSSDFSFECNW